MSISIYLQRPCPFLGELVCLTGFFFTLCVPLVFLKLGVVIATKTATARNMSLESKQLCYCDCFAIISSCSHCKFFSKNATTELVCTPLN